MNVLDATEIAYKNGYKKGKEDAVRDSDVVEVVRCKDCKNWRHETDGMIEHYECTVFSGCYGRGYLTGADDFCSYGAKMDGGTMADMSMRDRLIELLETVPTDEAGNRNVGVIAEHLLANGVLVPPCKVGDSLWWFSEDDNESDFGVFPAGVHEDQDGIPAIVWDGHEWGVLQDGDVLPIGTKYAFVTREDAERAFEEWRKEND